MSNPEEDIWPLPDYNPGPPKHLHALGVISTCYNAFEDGMFRLYLHHPDNLKLPRKLAEQFYLSLNEQQRLVAIKTIFDEYEKDSAVSAVVLNLIKYFQWSWDVRNKLVHAEHYPAAFGGKPGKWHLSKRVGKKAPDRGYMELELQTLREMADKIELGKKHCAGLLIYLRVRDTPASQLPISYRVLADAPLPEILAIPDALELSSSPQTPIPTYVRKSPFRSWKA
jgi:hypothetical protein